MDEFNKVFSENLKTLLAINKMQQGQLAALLGVSAASVTGWIKGDTSPRMDKVDKMCEIFGCDRSELMEPRETREQRKIELLNKVFTEQRALLSATDGLSADDIKILIAMAERLKAGYRE